MSVVGGLRDTESQLLRVTFPMSRQQPLALDEAALIFSDLDVLIPKFYPVTTLPDPSQLGGVRSTLTISGGTDRTITQILYQSPLVIVISLAGTAAVGRFVVALLKVIRDWKADRFTAIAHASIEMSKAELFESLVQQVQMGVALPLGVSPAVLLQSNSDRTIEEIVDAAMHLPADIEIRLEDDET